MIERHRKEGREEKEERARQIGKRERGMESGSREWGKVLPGLFQLPGIAFGKTALDQHLL